MYPAETGRVEAPEGKFLAKKFSAHASVTAGTESALHRAARASHAHASPSMSYFVTTETALTSKGSTY